MLKPSLPSVVWHWYRHWGTCLLFCFRNNEFLERLSVSPALVFKTAVLQPLTPCHCILAIIFQVNRFEYYHELPFLCPAAKCGSPCFLFHSLLCAMSNWQMVCHFFVVECVFCLALFVNKTHILQMYFFKKSFTLPTICQDYNQNTALQVQIQIISPVRTETLVISHVVSNVLSIQLWLPSHGMHFCWQYGSSFLPSHTGPCAPGRSIHEKNGKSHCGRLLGRCLRSPNVLNALYT